MTSAWPRQRRTGGDIGETSASTELPSPSVPFVSTMMTPTPTVALVSTPPTVCGLATFTSNLSAAIAAPESGWSTVVVRIMDRAEAEVHDEVVVQWVTGDRASLRRAVEAIESSDAVVLQHEYGLFGGPDGEDVLDLIEAVQVPLVAVLHTVLLDPTLHQRQILEQVMAAASLTVVQSGAARRRLIAVHGADAEQVVVVPHGAAANFVGPVLPGIERPAVLTWGLIGPGKGIELDRRPARSPGPSTHTFESGGQLAAPLPSGPPPTPGLPPQPLDEIRPRSEADFHDPLAVVSRELGKGMDERLLPVTPLLDLLEILR